MSREKIQAAACGTLSGLQRPWEAELVVHPVAAVVDLNEAFQLVLNAALDQLRAKSTPPRRGYPIHSSLFPAQRDHRRLRLVAFHPDGDLDAPGRPGEGAVLGSVGRELVENQAE